MWSQLFAEEIARTLGCEAGCSVFEEVVGELAETFRHLPLDKIQWTRDFACFLRGQRVPSEIGASARSWLGDKLSEVRDWALFLRGRHGYEQPVDESGEWTEEDEREATEASLRRRDEEDPYPWEESDSAQSR